jgi:hypothetical protein
MGAVRITLTAIAQNVNFFLLENHQAAIAVPINPPWKDIPPCQTAMISSCSHEAFLPSTQTYMAGITKSVRKVEVVSPKATTMAIRSDALGQKRGQHA